MSPQEPYPDVPPAASDDEIVDPSIPEGNATQVIIRRHPFGIVALYLQAGVALLAAIALIRFLIPSLLGEEALNRANGILSLFGVVAIALTAVFLLIATAIYRNNFWIITNDSISQIQQNGIFRRQRSELSMANIEDVTSEQTGVLAELFGFGTLKCETAGERSNFHFIYCPHPDRYAQILLHARERFIESDPRTAKRANEMLNLPPAQ